MPSTAVDEETPLLTVRPVQTPLPWRQLSVLLFLQLAEPLTSQVIYPFAPQLIREVGITNGDEKKVGYYVGILQSSFFAAQALTVLNWSRLSDKIGRKPVLITGLFGISVSMWAFGLSTTFWSLVISRCINGALNGNIGVMKSMMAEFTDSTNVAQAFAYLPIAWATGSTLGPLIGGSLSRPAGQFPGLFGNSELFKAYPYLLPCSISACYAMFAMFVAWFLLEETVPTAVSIKQLFLGKLGFRRSKDLLITKPAPETANPSVLLDESEKPRPLRSLLTSRVLISTLNYSMISFVDIAYRGVMPIFFSTSVSLGGLGFSPASIGACLSIYGICNGLFAVTCFARIYRRFGGKRVLTFSLMLGFPIFALFPIMSIWTKHYGYVTPAVWAMILLQTFFSILFGMSYSSVFIYIAAASPDRRSIGATNGIAQMAVSIMRTFGPSFANSLYSLSMEHNYMGGWLVWWALLATVAVAVACASLLPSKAWKRIGEE